ncbi:phosphotransferase [Aggregatibacter actinomycetemcomitans]|uniref:choline/ethanolamine kinase family protein n=1 Tax=Aggregatibacter actinomycetemcomitans TaxID=714 RepID=UPI00197BCCD0|nr:choline/ethanolamine kinase family protein [Aggregatibacter actinomycetemcomitans]MBN6081959.1 phosphotransferase [Aggregatibacter actinomycetemcomitans]
MNIKKKFIKEYNLLLKSLRIKDSEVIEFSLIGGMTNTNFFLNTRKGKFVARISGKATEFFINRDNEIYNSTITALKLISPEIVYFDNESGIKVSKYINNAETLSPKTARRDFYLIADKIAELHTSDIKFKNTFIIKHEFLKYLTLINQNHYKLDESFLQIKDLFLVSLDQLEYSKTKLCPCHNDLVPENFVLNKKSNQLYIIDWEYSGMNDPAWDIASIFYEANFDYKDEMDFLNYYLSRINSTSEKENFLQRILIYKISQCLLWYLWTIIKENNGESFPNYAKNRLINAKKLITEYKGKYIYEK